ncbi:MAG: iron-sulfur cluster assembly scaffold protein [Oceanicaulis sp.]
MTDAYSSDVLKLAADIPHLGRLGDPSASARKVSRICGSELTLDLRLDGAGRIADLGLELQACALGQASASVFARSAIGADEAEIEAARGALKAMLQQGAAPPEGRFSDLKALAPAAAYRQRHGSILLVFDAALDAFAQAAVDSASSAAP